MSASAGIVVLALDTLEREAQRWHTVLQSTLDELADARQTDHMEHAYQAVGAACDRLVKVEDAIGDALAALLKEIAEQRAVIGGAA